MQGKLTMYNVKISDFGLSGTQREPSGVFFMEIPERMVIL
jgi:hypothetical protein